jgi:UDP-2,3-diacylglucosamine hydrolase
LQKSIYFLSDFHLGAPNHAASLQREKQIVNFLDNIKNTASEIFLLGDIFDFWFEYKTVIPKGYVRILGKLANLTDAGIPIHVFVGNHDMWMKDYFKQELNIDVYYNNRVFNRHGKKLFIGHGDGMGPGDTGYKIMKKIFRNPICNWAFARLHPNFGIGLANYLSRRSRAKTGQADEIFLGNNKEWLVAYCLRKLEEQHYDYFLFGHRHLPLNITLNNNSTYINTGDWIRYNSYAVLEPNGSLYLKYYEA